MEFFSVPTAASAVEYQVSEEVKAAGFNIDPDDLATIVRGHDLKKLSLHGGLAGISTKIRASRNEGVSDSDLATRQKVFGLNRYVDKPCRTFWLFVWEAFHDLTLVILMACSVVSVAVGLATEGWPKGMYDGFGIILSVFLVVTVTATSDHRQYLQFQDLDKEKKKIFVQVTRNGYRQKVTIHEIVVGDIVHLSVGDQVPADGLFLSGYSLLVDEASMSGESEPVHIQQEKPFLLSGTKIQDGSGIMLVTAVGMRTEWGKLMEALGEGREDETPLQMKLNGVATTIGKIGLAFSISTFFVLIVRFIAEKAIKGDFFKWGLSDALVILNYFAIAVVILVVAVPEGLPLAVTLSLAFAMKKLMSEKALVRHLSACETMGSATCLCSDKTGTLTTNYMIVNKLWICEEIHEVKEKGSGIFSKLAIPDGVLGIALQSIFQNTSAEVVKNRDGENAILGTPTESAMLEFGFLLGGDFATQRQESRIVKVEPFNSVRKKMSVVVALQGGGYRAFCKGASEIILGMCRSFIDGNHQIVSLSETQTNHIMDIINNFAGEALRTLCLAFQDMGESFEGDIIPVDGYTLIAVVGIKDPVRPGVKEAVKTCLSAGITVRMITGDNINTATAIAKECGILTDDGLAISGPDFRVMSLSEMKELIPKIQVLARSMPLDKHTLVTHLRNMFDEVVAVTGDGTNDAPALRESDIGLAMGIVGTEVAKDNADVIILDDNFATIVNVAKWGRAVYINIQKFVQFQLTVNVVALVVNFVSACITGYAPLTAVQLLWVNMIMDTLGALALATEPPNDDLMKRVPVSRSASFISRTMWRNIIGQCIYQLAILGVLEFDGKRLLMLNGADAESVLNTFVFNTFVFCQMFNEINSREIEKINVFRSMLCSWIFMGVMSSTIIFQVIIVEFLGDFANTVPLSWQLWLTSILIGSVSMIISVGLKCIPVEHVKNVKDNNGYKPLPSGPEMELP